MLCLKSHRRIINSPLLLYKNISRNFALQSSYFPKVIILSGTTGIGKSDVAMKLTDYIDAEIVIADSVQMYKGLNIGANKPTFEDTERVKHHLLSVCDLTGPAMTTGIFVRNALEIIKDINSRGKIALFVGGSTMYMDWLVHGIPDSPAADTATRKQAQNMLAEYITSKDWTGAVKLVQSMSKDVEVAGNLARNNFKQLQRVLEIALSKKPSTVLNEDRHLSPGSRCSGINQEDTLCVFLSPVDRSSLYRKLDHRCIAMLKKGLLKETSTVLLDVGSLECQVLQSIGYRQCIDYLRGKYAPHIIKEIRSFTDKFKMPTRHNVDSFLNFFDIGSSSGSVDVLDLLEFQAMFSDFAVSTRNYAKYQMQWFRRDKSFIWISGLQGESDCQRCVDEILALCSHTGTINVVQKYGNDATFSDNKLREKLGEKHKIREYQMDCNIGPLLQQLQKLYASKSSGSYEYAKVKCEIDDWISVIIREKNILKKEFN